MINIKKHLETLFSIAIVLPIFNMECMVSTRWTEDTQNFNMTTSTNSDNSEKHSNTNRGENNKPSKGRELNTVTKRGSGNELSTVTKKPRKEDESNSFNRNSKMNTKANSDKDESLYGAELLNNSTNTRIGKNSLYLTPTKDNARKPTPTSIEPRKRGSSYIQQNSYEESYILDSPTDYLTDDLDSIDQEDFKIDVSN